MHRTTGSPPRTLELIAGDMLYLSGLCAGLAEEIQRVARRARKRWFPEVFRVLKGPAFWSPSYCAVSCGGAPLETIKEYVRTQAGVPAVGGPASGAASSPGAVATHAGGIRGFEVPERFKR